MRFVSLLLLVGCGDNTIGDPFALASGWRLELRWLVYEDGARQWDPSSFHDAELGVDCRIRQWSDGHAYCTPEASGVAYGDPSCQIAVGIAPRFAVPPELFRRDYVRESETIPSRMYRRTSNPGSLGQFWRFQNNACEGPFPGGDYDFYEVEDLDVVRIKTTEPLGDGRLGLRMRTSDDGLRIPFGLHDTLVDEDCAAAPLPDGSVACIPGAARRADYFRDPACSEHLLVISQVEPVPRVASVVDDEACQTYYVVGDEQSKFPLYARLAGRCIEVEVPDTDLAFGLAGPLALATLEQRARGGSRLQPIELVNGLLHLPGAGVFDADLSQTCQPVPDDGGVRCMPPSASVATGYRDAECRSLIRVGQVRSRRCDSPEQIASAYGRDGLVVYELGPVVPTPLYVLTASCKPLEIATGLTPYQLGPQIPSSTFVAGRQD